MSNIFHCIVFLIGLCLISACDPGNVTMNLLAYDSATDSYILQDVDVKTLTDVWRLEGEATVLYGDAELTVNNSEGFLNWADQGHSVAFSAIEKDGVLIPADYHSLAMASIYYNVELSMLFFREIGLQRDTVGALPTYYWCNLSIVDTGGEESGMLDNAFYMYVDKSTQGFLVLPFDWFQWIPMPMNRGIMTHEYTHAVFEALVLGPNANIVDSWNAAGTSPAANFLYGINEGTADYMAVASTGDPDFIEHSIQKGLFGDLCNSSVMEHDIVREADFVLAYSSSMERAAREKPMMDYCPYNIARFWTSMLYGIAVAIDDEQSEIPSEQARYRVAKWMLHAIDDLGKSLLHDFEIWDLLSLFVTRISSPKDRDAACSIIEERYNYDQYFTYIEGC